MLLALTIVHRMAFSVASSEPSSHTAPGPDYSSYRMAFSVASSESSSHSAPGPDRLVWGSTTRIIHQRVSQLVQMYVYVAIVDNTIPQCIHVYCILLYFICFRFRLH